MGIDGSTSSTGWAIFKNKELIDYGIIKPKGGDWRSRLFNEGVYIDEIIKKYSPEKIYMEDVPLDSKGGLKTLVVLGGVQGFFYGIASTNRVPIEFISPNTWRSNIGLYDGTNNGKKREFLKQKAIEKVNEIFGLSLCWHGINSKKTEDDVAEAILICASMLNIITQNKRFGKIK